MNAFVLIAPFHHLEVVEVGKTSKRLIKGKLEYMFVLYVLCIILYIRRKGIRARSQSPSCRVVRNFEISNVNLLHFSIDQETTVKNLKVTLNMQHKFESSFLTAGVKVASSIASYALELTP